MPGLRRAIAALAAPSPGRHDFRSHPKRKSRLPPSPAGRLGGGKERKSRRTDSVILRLAKRSPKDDKKHTSRFRSCHPERSLRRTRRISPLHRRKSHHRSATGALLPTMPRSHHDAAQRHGAICLRMSRHRHSSLRSFHFGLFDRIRSSFRFRRQPFSAFSRAIASVGLPNSSKYSSRVTR